MILPQEAGASENNRKGIAKATPKIESIYILIFIYVCSACNPVQLVVSCKHELIL